jgi:hypothetical protein
MSRGRSVSLLLCSIDSESRSWGDFVSKDSKFKFETEGWGQRISVILYRAKVGDGCSCKVGMARVSSSGGNAKNFRDSQAQRGRR